MKKQVPFFPEKIFPEHVGSFMNDLGYDDNHSNPSGASNSMSARPMINQSDQKKKSDFLTIGAWALARGKRH